MSELTFKLTPEADINMSSRQLGTHFKPIDLIRLFGKPHQSDEYKVSGEYIFTSGRGDIITLYDYKQTSLYDERLIKPEDFWRLKVLTAFHIGGYSQEVACAFNEWLDKKIEEA